jgi:hypothetical protein
VAVLPAGTKVLYGSDWPVAETRGKCITLGDSFM